MIDLTPYQLEIVLDILKKYVPFCEVRVFGSRYKWTSKNYSDLDLAIVGNKKLDKKLIYDLKEAFSESDLPIRVDALDWYAISDEFKQIINQGYEVIQKREKQLPDCWEIKKLGDVIDMTTGKLNANQAVDNGIYPFFTCAPEPYRINEFNFDCNAVLLAGNNANGNFHVNRYCGKFNAYQRTYVITVNHNNDINFIYYKLKNIISDFVGTSQGSATKFLTRPLIENKFIELPPLTTQKQIASILSSLDEKIDINNQINKKLEEIAQALFKHWFVDFNFPDENGSPYKDSGGAMIDSELGEIPKGWQVISLDDHLDFVRGVEPGSKEYNNNKISDEYIQFIRVSDLQSLGSTYIHKILAKDKLVDECNVLMSFDGTIGRVKIGLSGAYSSGIRKVINKNISKYNFSNQFIYFLLKNENIQNTIITNATGTTILHAGHTIKLLKIAVNNEIIKVFNETLLPLYSLLISNYKETKLLQQIRDLLLPKLLSGEIDV